MMAFVLAFLLAIAGVVVVGWSLRWRKREKERSAWNFNSWNLFISSFGVGLVLFYSAYLVLAAR